MKVFLLGFVLVALSEIIVAAPRGNGKKEGWENKNRSQLDMLLAQMKQQQDQIQRLQEARRSDNGTLEDMKKLIHDEMDPLIDGLKFQVSGLKTQVLGLSQCEVGTYNVSVTRNGLIEGTKTIFFRRNFTLTPKVVTAVATILGDRWNYDSSFRGVSFVPKRPTTTKFDLLFYCSDANRGCGASWIACA